MFEITNLPPDQVAAIKAAASNRKYPFDRMDNVGDSFTVPCTHRAEAKRIRNSLSTLTNAMKAKHGKVFMVHRHADGIIVVRVG